jgi:hypothetical protein
MARYARPEAAIASALAAAQSISPLDAAGGLDGVLCGGGGRAPTCSHSATSRLLNSLAAGPGNASSGTDGLSAGEGTGIVAFRLATLSLA